jgi:hypothetical protein
VARRRALAVNKSPFWIMNKSALIIGELSIRRRHDRFIDLREQP